MEKFINARLYRKFFPIVGTFGVSNVGYNDFSLENPAFGIRALKNPTWHFVLSGKGLFEIGGKSYPLIAGQAFFIPSDIPMRYYPDKDDPWEYVWFTLYGKEDVDAYSKLLNVSVTNPVITVKNFEKLKSALRKMFDSLIDETSGYFCALSCFYQIMDICTSSAPKTEIQKIKNIIDESFTIKSFNVEQLCSEVNISHPHLLRLFKNAYGTTIVKYILKKRIEYACNLLTSSDMPIKAVAFSCGFSDELHFMKTFKKELGISALSYRKKALSKIN